MKPKLITLTIATATILTGIGAFITPPLGEWMFVTSLGLLGVIIIYLAIVGGCWILSKPTEKTSTKQVKSKEEIEARKAQKRKESEYHIIAVAEVFKTHLDGLRIKEATYDKNSRVLTIVKNNGETTQYKNQTFWKKLPFMDTVVKDTALLSQIVEYIEHYGNPYPTAHLKQQQA